MDMDENLNNALDKAYNEASKLKHEFLTPEHLLFFMLMDEDLLDVLSSAEVDIEKLCKDLHDFLRDKVPIVGTVDEKYEPIMTVGLTTVLNAAFEHCYSSEKKEVGVLDVLIAMFDSDKSYCSYLLKKNGAVRLELLEAIRDRNFGGEEEDDDDIDEQFSEIVMGLHSDLPKDGKFLEKYAVNLTEKAANGEIDELIGREDEIDQTIQTLCRRTKNNPLHIGDAGVGKTAITEGLALKIHRGEVPEMLKGFSLYSINMSFLLAGTKFRGEFEEKLKGISDELMRRDDCIIFIDEIHTVVGAGSGADGSIDAANLLKPLFASGKARCIGATTPEEYRKYFERDRALARRFQVIEIKEPSRDDALKILQGLAPKYGKFHGVKYGKEVLECALDLSIRLLPDRRLPDKAIDIIDEVGSHAKIHAVKDSETDGEKSSRAKVIPITVEMVKKVVSKMARVPVEDVARGEGEILRDLEKKIESQIFGQDDAVRLVVNAVKKSRAGYRDVEKPEAAFLFVGPTGVGKTELTKVLSKELNENLLRIDMSEYQEKHSVSRLIGSPPGYVGFEEGGMLTSAVRTKPHSIILFDEIEKAHRDVFNILLQVMDYGSLTDSKGQKADFRNCIIIMTSNAGARDLEKSAVGFNSGRISDKNDRATVMHAVEEAFTPEFRNRLDAIVPFSQLDRKIVLDIARKEVKKIGSRLSSKKIKLVAGKKVYEYIAEKGYSREFGARNIARTAENLVATPLVDEILFGSLSKGGTVTVSVDSEGEGLSFEYGGLKNAAK